MIYQSSELCVVVDSAVGTVARDVKMIPALLVFLCNRVIAMEAEGAAVWKQGVSWQI